MGGRLHALALIGRSGRPAAPAASRVATGGSLCYTRWAMVIIVTSDGRPASNIAQTPDDWRRQSLGFGGRDPVE